MKERPILFQGAMVRALLAGTKTQTRRIVKLPVIDRDVGCEIAGNELAGSQRDTYRHSPYGVPGDRLWVRENVWQAGAWHQTHPEDDSWSDWGGSRRLHYTADGNPPNEPNRDYPEGLRNGAFSAAEPDRLWRHLPSIHMQRWMSRLTLEVVDVRVERLRSISQNDAWAEGLELDGEGICWIRGSKPHIESTDPIDCYALLWDSINAKPKPVLGDDGKVAHYISFPWEVDAMGEVRRHRGKRWYVYPNPWVWVVEFRKGMT